MKLTRGAVVHLVGVGGAGMAALADLLLDRGVTLTGSDLLRADCLQRLESRGVGTSVGEHSARHLPT